jgi:hypothetical protein
LSERAIEERPQAALLAHRCQLHHQVAARGEDKPIGFLGPVSQNTAECIMLAWFEPDGDGFCVSFRGIPEALTSGGTMEEALGTSPQVVNRIVDHKHVTKIDTIAEALEALGKHLELAVV